MNSMGARRAVIARARNLLRGRGWDIIRWTGLQHPLGQRMRLLRHYGVTVVLDVGANEGQYGRELRLAGYKGRIVSFEPMAAPFAKLATAARSDPGWDVVQLALGEANAETEINVSRNSVSRPVEGLTATPSCRRTASCPGATRSPSDKVVG